VDVDVENVDRLMVVVEVVFPTTLLRASIAAPRRRAARFKLMLDLDGTCRG